MHIEFLDHTADVKVRASGKDFATACAAAAKACTQWLTKEHIQSRTEHSLRVQARTLDGVLYDFLSEVIYLQDAKQFLVHDAKLQLEHTATEYVLHGVLHGDAASSYHPEGDIKAITYHELQVRQEDGCCTLEFVLDI